MRSSARLPLSFFSLSFVSAGQTDALHVHVPTAETRSHASERVCWMSDLKKQM